MVLKKEHDIECCIIPEEHFALPTRDEDEAFIIKAGKKCDDNERGLRRVPVETARERIVQKRRGRKKGRKNHHQARQQDAVVEDGVFAEEEVIRWAFHENEMEQPSLPNGLSTTQQLRSNATLFELGDQHHNHHHHHQPGAFHIRSQVAHREDDLNVTNHRSLTGLSASSIPRLEATAVMEEDDEPASFTAFPHFSVAVVATPEQQPNDKYQFERLERSFRKSKILIALVVVVFAVTMIGVISYLFANQSSTTTPVDPPTVSPTVQATRVQTTPEPTTSEPTTPEPKTPPTSPSPTTARPTTAPTRFPTPLPTTAWSSSRGQVGDSCSLDKECENFACGRLAFGDDDQLVCCPSGVLTRYAGYDYCTERPRGTKCGNWIADIDNMCASNNCSNDRCQ